MRVDRENKSVPFHYCWSPFITADGNGRLVPSICHSWIFLVGQRWVIIPSMIRNYFLCGVSSHIYVCELPQW